MRKSSWVWLLSLALLVSFSGLAFADEVKEVEGPEQPVKVEEKGLLWLAGGPRVMERTNLDEVVEFLNETFDNGIPADWTTAMNGATTVPWDTLPSIGWGSGAAFITETPPFAGIDSDAEGSVDVDADILTPEIVIPANAYLECWIEFDYSFRHYGSDLATFSYTIDGGTTWVDFFSTSVTDYESKAFDLLEIVGAEGATIQFKWNYVANYSYHMAFDNVLIVGTDEDIRPPVISLLDAPAEVLEGYDADFLVVVNDPSGITSADLLYHEWDDTNDTLMVGGYSGTVALTTVNGDTMAATIVGTDAGYLVDDMVAFWFEAVDSAPGANVARLPENDGAYYGFDVVADEEAPMVDPIAMPPFTFLGEDGYFEFEITDELTDIGAATLYYAEFDTTETNYGPVPGGVSGSIDMMPGVDGIFTASVPGVDFVVGDFVGYYMVVSDTWTPANTDTLPGATDGTPDYDFYEVLENPDILWDFEADEGDMVSSDPVNVWQWGNPEGSTGGEDWSGNPYPAPAAAFSGNNVWATIVDGPYDSNVDGYLTTTVAWALDAGAMLRLAHWYHTESWDGHNVQISLDLGETWMVIEPLEGYTDSNGTIQGLDGENGWNTYNYAYWQLATFDLSAYEGEMVMFRLRFGSDSSGERYGAAIDDFMLWGALVPGELDGVVTDASDVPVEGASVTLYLHNTDVEVARTMTDEDGYYHMFPLPGNYDVIARQYGFLNAEADSVDIFEETLTTADIQMTAGVETDTLRGTVWGDMDMTMPLEGVVVSIPDEGFGAFTPGDGTFDFGEVDHGAYDIVLTSVPTGYMGYHDVYLFDYEITDRTLPLDLFMPEILPPMNVSATTGDGEVLLVWDAPEDYFPEEEFESMPGELEELRAMYDAIVEEGNDEDQAKLPVLREEIFRMEQALLRHNRAQIDQVSDFAGYRIMLNGEIWNEEPLETLGVLVGGLDNGLEYEIMVAADYGYHDNYLVWSEPLYVRPLPAPDYLWEEVTYDWFELNPANGGPGTVWMEAGDDANTGLDPLGFDFTFYGSVYNELAACSNGWLSFIDGDETDITLTLPSDSETQPNAVLAPMNDDLDMEVAGDAYNIWSYYDAATGLYYVQYFGKYWSDESDTYSFQMILDTNDNTIIYQYQTASNGWDVNGSQAGIENAEGTQAVVIPGAQLYDGMAVKFFMEGGELGNFEGMITDIADDAPIANAVVKAVSSLDRTYVTASDEDGDYQLLLLNRDAGPYTVTVRAEGYEDLVVENVDWDEADGFVHYVDFALTELSPDSPPRVVGVNVDFDDRFEVTLGAPGSLTEVEYIVMDDGTMGGVYAWTLPPTPDQMAGTGFNVAGSNVTLLSAEVHCGIDYSGGDAWPDATHEPIVFKILADDGGMPGEILWTSEPVDVDVATEWATVAIDIPVESSFYVMLSNPDGDVGQEGISVDSANDYANYWYNAGTGWNHLTTASGDPLIRATVQYVPGGGDGTEEAVLDPSRLASGKDNANTPISSAMNAEVWGLNAVRNVTRPHVELPASSTSLDAVGDVLWYMLDYSLDGTTWTAVEIDGSTLIDPATPVIPVVLGSENENTEYMYRASAWMTDPDGVVDSLMSQYAEGVATYNMMPAAPAGFTAAVDGTTITLTADIPTTNADGTDLIDLAQYKAWEVTAEGLVEVGVSTTEAITFTAPATGLYTYTVTAEDEVPNVSGTAMPMTVMAGDPGVGTSFEPGEWNAMMGEGVWEHGAPTAGPMAAFEGDNVWATVLGDWYNNDQSDMLYSIEPLTVGSDQALFIYYHWVEYEGGWDGYNLKVSTDEGASWMVVEPIGGYPGTVFGLDDEPGFSGSTGAWQMVMVPLGDFVGQNIAIGFHHGTDGSVREYFGVALDNFAMYDIQPPVYGSVTGTIYECDANGMTLGGVEIWADGWPVPLGVSNPDGTFDVECPVGTWDILFVHDDYWTTFAEDVVVAEGVPSVIGDVYMTYPEGLLSPTSLELAYDVETETPVPTEGTFEIENTGCGPLEYSVSVQILNGLINETPGGELPTPRESVPEARSLTSGAVIGPVVGTQIDEPWDLIASYDQIEAGTGAPDNFGYAMGATNFYVGGFYYGTLTTFAYDGTYVDQIDIDASMQGSSITGLFGLSNDPSGYLYGGNVDGDIFKFSPDMTEVVSQGTTQLRPISVAYDFDNNVFYTSDFSNGFYSMSPNGTPQTIPLPTSGAIYGLAYVPMDPEGYTIYAHVETNPTTIIRYNPSTQAWNETPVATVYTLVVSENGDSCGDMAAGMRGESYDFLTAMQGGADGAGVDLADLWEGYTLQQWLTISPAEGNILPGETQQFIVTVDPTQDEAFNPAADTQTELFITISGPHMDDFGLFVTIDWTGSVEETQLPTEYALHQNYPNPFNPSTSIKFALVEAQQVKLTVYNMLGQEVTRLVNTRMQAGYHTINFDASHLASGVYFYRLETPAYTNMKKMVMIK
jgi:hypothetical protein